MDGNEMPKPDWATADGRVVLYNRKWEDVLPLLPIGCIDAVITDPPYLMDDGRVPIRGRGVSDRIEESESVGMPWGYSLEWIEACQRLDPDQWIIYAHYRMLGELCSRFVPQTVFIWRKSNAPRMTRPVPRLDCEFILWARTGGKCGRMGEFDSMVIDVPMPQAGCFANERILVPGSGKAAHPCQKPLAVVQPFISRLPCVAVLDPFFGTGTTIVAAMIEGKRAIGCESDAGHFATAVKRISGELNRAPLFEPPPLVQRSLIDTTD